LSLWLQVSSFLSWLLLYRHLIHSLVKVIYLSIYFPKYYVLFCTYSCDDFCFSAFSFYSSSLCYVESLLIIQWAMNCTFSQHTGKKLILPLKFCNILDFFAVLHSLLTHCYPYSIIVFIYFSLQLRNLRFRISRC
jgi:hypothetical protein